RVQLSGASLPAGVVAATDYWVIRKDHNVRASNNVQPTPVIQLASSAANAAAGTAIPITGSGTGSITRMNSFWLQDINTKNLLTGDSVTIPSPGTPPPPLVNNGTYYWISYGKQEIKDGAGNFVAYGSGFVASTQANALAGVGVTLTGIGSG